MSVLVIHRLEHVSQNKHGIQIDTHFSSRSQSFVLLSACLADQVPCQRPSSSWDDEHPATKISGGKFPSNEASSRQSPQFICEVFQEIKAGTTTIGIDPQMWQLAAITHHRTYPFEGLGHVSSTHLTVPEECQASLRLLSVKLFHEQGCILHPLLGSLGAPEDDHHLYKTGL